MLKFIAIALIAVIIVFTVIVSLQPDEFRVSRSATMAAPAALVFEQVNDLSKWNAWSPWAKLDPEAKSAFEGPAAGIGAIMRWDGNSQVGKGSMRIDESRANELVRFTLEFLKPMEATNTAEFAFKEEGGRTTVTWSMHGKNNFIGKAMGLLFNCEKIVGSQFEQGLTNLQTIVEGNRGAAQ